MWKTILAGTAALAIAGSSIVYAQQRLGRSEQPRWQPSQEDIAAFAAARIAALRAGLVLTPEQDKLWPAYESALKDLSRYRVEQRAMRRSEQPANDPVTRLRRQADALSGYGAALKKVADAQEPLYSSLDDAQKRRFAILERVIQRAGRWHNHHGMRRGMAGSGGHGRRSDDWRGGEHGRWRNRAGRDDGHHGRDVERDRGDQSTTNDERL